MCVLSDIVLYVSLYKRLCKIEIKKVITNGNNLFNNIQTLIHDKQTPLEFSYLDITLKTKKGWVLDLNIL